MKYIMVVVGVGVAAVIALAYHVAFSDSRKANSCLSLQKKFTAMSMCENSISCHKDYTFYLEVINTTQEIKNGCLLAAPKS